MSTVVVTGGPQGGVANRLNIYDLVKDENLCQFSLFIQALGNLSYSCDKFAPQAHSSFRIGDIAQMMEMNQEDPVSYFQIAGIHGLPYVRWKGEGEGSGKDERKGYCNHGSVLFPTWHRPYISLFEVRSSVSTAFPISFEYVHS